MFAGHKSRSLSKSFTVISNGFFINNFEMMVSNELIPDTSFPNTNPTSSSTNNVSFSSCQPNEGKSIKNIIIETHSWNEIWLCKT